MKGVTEIHISCAFHEHNKCNTKLLIIDNWNQRHIGVFMTALFLKNCRQCKNWKFRPLSYPFYPWENKKLTKNKTGKKIYIFYWQKKEFGKRPRGHSQNLTQPLTSSANTLRS